MSDLQHPHQPPAYEDIEKLSVLELRILGARACQENAVAEGLFFFSAIINKHPESATADDYVNRSHFSVCMGNDELGIHDCTTAIRMNPLLEEAYNNRAAAWLHLKNYEKALADLTHLIELNPAYPGVYCRRAIIHGRLGRKHDLALQDYTEAIQRDPFDAQALQNRAYLFQELKQYRESIRDYTDAIRVNPQYSIAYDNRASAFFEMGMLERALEDYTQAILHSPNDPQFYAHRAYVYCDLGRFGMAMQDLSVCLAACPFNVAALTARAKCHGNLGRAELAILDLSEILRINPDVVSAYTSRGLNYVRLGKLTLAERDFSEAIRLQPEDADNFFNRGVMRLDYLEAFFDEREAEGLGVERIEVDEIQLCELSIQDFSKAIEMCPDDGVFHVCRGKIYNRLKRFNLSVVDFSEAIAKNSPAYRLRAIAYRELGKLAESAMDFTEAIRHDPDDLESVYDRAWVRYDLRQFELAVADFSELHRRNPSSLQGLKGRAMTYSAMRSYDMAIQDLTELIRLNPQNVSALNDRGLAYHQMNLLDLALKDIDAAVKLTPRDPSLLANRARVCLQNPNDDPASSDQSRSSSVLHRAVKDLSESLRLWESGEAESEYPPAPSRCLWLRAYAHFRLNQVSLGEKDLIRSYSVEEPPFVSLSQSFHFIPGLRECFRAAVAQLTDECEAIAELKRILEEERD